MSVDDILDMTEAAELAENTPGAMRKAAQRGTLPAKRVGGADNRATWVTTRQAVEEYIAAVTARRIATPRDAAGRIAARSGW